MGKQAVEVICALKKILINLQEQIQQWREAGDRVIILADMNNDVHIDPIQTAVIQMGQAEAITTQHGPNTPNTHNCRSKPIDRIFLEPNLIQTISSGYLAFIRVGDYVEKKLFST